jgi:hypothetical protein
MRTKARGKRYEYQIGDTMVTLVNPPMRGNHRQLAPTAEAWHRFAVTTYGPGVVDFTVEWNEHGRVSHRVEYSDGRVLA